MEVMLQIKPEMTALALRARPVAGSFTADGESDAGYPQYDHCFRCASVTPPIDRAVERPPPHGGEISTANVASGSAAPVRGRLTQSLGPELVPIGGRNGRSRLATQNDAQVVGLEKLQRLRLSLNFNRSRDHVVAIICDRCKQERE